ncbi:hypothetical protein ABMA27_010343 [Loxostege sticticalis]|uniref:Reverse transcriptase domain-containing protein n=1 Tax=Loxostege sticticalis TaxID=481309 RepID=A0ABR3H5E2_LOXSC
MGTVGGGVSIFVTNQIEHHLIEEMTDDDDNNFLWIYLKKFSIEIGVVYKPGRTNSRRFLDTYALQLSRKKRAVIIGDFNYDLLEPDTEVNDYNATLEENGFRILNKVSPKYCTRETMNKKSLLDHVCTNLKENQFYMAIIESNMSDHKQIFLEVKKYQPSLKQKVKYEAIDYGKLYERMKLNMANSNNDKFHIFEDILCETIQESKSFKTKILNPPKQDWINAKIINKINKKNLLYRKHKKNPNNEHLKNQFMTEKKLVTDEIRKMKKDYHYKQLSTCKNNPRKMWSLINNLTHNKVKEISSPTTLIDGARTITDGHEICEHFNKYFATIGLRLVEAIPRKYHNDRTNTAAIVNCNQNSFGLASLAPVTADEILKIINNLDPNTSSGLDKMNTKSIKCVGEHIARELSNCINLCLEAGEFPTSLKTAKVTPIFKSGSRLDSNNYRPISVLPVLSKIFERVIYNRLVIYLDSINYLYSQQYGFRSKSSTLSATADLVTKIKNSIDEKNICLGIFIDLKKAFDTVSHTILRNKLRDIGIEGNAHKILESYLTARSQVVEIPNFQSSPAAVTFGVPQGSILGPLLFLIYINGISNLELKGDLSLYADDTCLFYFGSEIDSIIQDAQSDLDLLDNWFQYNLLTINVAKTHYVIFSAKNKDIPDFEPLKINDITISKSESEKYLGLVLDNRLTWRKLKLNYYLLVALSAE